MTRPRLLDLFSGAGGAGEGYRRAGFDVTGVDIAAQPRYQCGRFIQADALEYLEEHGHEYEVIHASPPCQAYVGFLPTQAGKEYPELIEATRELLEATGKPFVIENIEGAPLENPLTLCGSMFGLKVVRHRLFECDPSIWFPPASCQCSHLYTASSRGFSSFENGATAITVAGNNFKADDGRAAMGIEWMTRAELAQAIPPAYCEFIGRQMLAHIGELTP